MSDRVTITETGQVATVTLSRPEKRNALDLAMIEGIVEAADSLKARRDIRAVVLAGGAGEAFCAGLDVSAMPMLAKVAGEAGFKPVRMVRRTCSRPPPWPGPSCRSRSSWPSRAMLSAADFRSCWGGPIYASRLRMHGFPSWKAAGGGWCPTWGGHGADAASGPRRYHSPPDLYGRTVFGHGCTDLGGFVTELAEDPLFRAQSLAAEIAAMSPPDAVRAAKALITETELTDIEDTLIAESVAQERLVGRPNQMEAVMAGMQKRPPVFRD